MGFSQGVSGLHAASEQLDVIGNNIANSQTAGFKSASVQFSEIFANSNAGLGVQVAGVNQNLSNGALDTGNALDMAIQGSGFFRLQDGSGAISYSRNGQISTDQYGYLLCNGKKLTGFQASGSPAVIKDGVNLGPIKIDVGGSDPAKASATGSIIGTLDANSTPPAATAFSANDNTTYNFTHTIEACDSLGNKHNIDVYYVKTADNQWTIHSLDHTNPNSTPADSTAQITFDTSGKLTTTPKSFTFNIAAYKGAAGNSCTMNISELNQVAVGAGKKSQIARIETDGYPAGTYQQCSVDDGGIVTATYTNGKRRPIAQVALASFGDASGLKPQGNNCWIESATSGQANLGVSGGSNGVVLGQKIEKSNVDLASEMVSMIVAQRNYQSNAQTIKTQDQVLQTLVNLG